MFCCHCGSELDERDVTCLDCGEDIRNRNPRQRRSWAQTRQRRSESKSSDMPVASLCRSIAGVFTLLFVGQIIGIILGYNARRQIAASRGALGGKGMASAGIIIGWAGIIWDMAIVMLIIAVMT